MLSIATALSTTLDDRLARVDSIFREWLADPQTMVVCGRWEQGSITELLPHGRASLSRQTYDGCFAGVRDLRIDGEDHHIHVDLGRFHRIEYVVAPSVCFQGKPSFEARFLLTTPDGATTRDWDLALAVSRPYLGRALNRGPVVGFFRRFIEHRRRHADLVGFHALVGDEHDNRVWREVVECCWEAHGASSAHGPDDADHAGALARAALAGTPTSEGGGG
jgi:hypothetical protein